MRHVFHRDTTAGRRLWIVGDGGQIRHSVANGPFVTQATPAGASHALLDVYFLADGANGWAAGVGGRILKTSNSGQTWTYLNAPPQAPLQNHCGEPAVIWRTRFLEPQLGFVCGLRTFQFTNAGGDLANEWQNVKLFDDQSLQLEVVSGNYEFYGLEILGTPSGFVGVCIAQSWTGHPCGNGQPGKGVVFYTDSANPASAGGRNWWITTRFDGSDPNHQGVTIEDPWDIEFEENPADIRNAVGYLAGGTGNADGGIYRTTNSGRSFTVEAGGVASGINTHYGVGALANGRAVACGYGGQIHSRDPQTGIWIDEKHGTFTGPLADVHRIGSGTDDCLVVGSWGFARYSLNAGNPWVSVNSASASDNTMLHRLEDVAFSSDLVGVAVGAKQTILRTTTGGCTWDRITGDYTNPMITSAFNAVALGQNGQGVAVGGGIVGDPLNHPVHFTADNGVTWSPATLSLAGLPPSVALRDVVRATGANYWAVGTEDTAAGARPLILFSANGGASFARITHTLPTDLQLNGAVFLSATVGFVVGHNGTHARAYMVNVSGSTVSFTDVSPTGLIGKLHGIAARGTSLFTASIYAVGGNHASGAEVGYVLKFAAQVPVGQSPRFLPVAAAPSLALPYVSVAMAADGPLVLVGCDNRIDEIGSTDSGKALRFDGTTWTTIKAQSSKAMRNVFLRSQTRGWAICRPDANFTSGEFGQVNDSMVVLYDPF